MKYFKEKMTYFTVYKVSGTFGNDDDFPVVLHHH